MNRAVIYVRVSSREQAEGGYSIGAQLEACRRFVSDKGWTVEDEFTELGESARTVNRPAFKAMAAMLDDHSGITHLVVHKIDRLARNLADYAAVKARLQKLGIRLVSVTEGMEEGPSGRLVEGIMAAIAEFYSDNLGQEVRKGMQQKVHRRLAAPCTSRLHQCSGQRSAKGRGRARDRSRTGTARDQGIRAVRIRRVHGQQPAPADGRTRVAQQERRSPKPLEARGAAAQEAVRGDSCPQRRRIPGQS